MNSSNAKDYLPLVQALAEGKYIQFRIKPGLDWIDVDEVTDAFSIECYRIKPEPKEIWVVIDSDNDGTHLACWSKADAEKWVSCGNEVTCYREVIE